MFIQILLDYRTLPNPYALTFDQVSYFYEGIRHLLRERTKPKAK